METNEQAIREFYAARARRDWAAVRSLLADEVGYHEPGDEDHSGDYRGRDDVVVLLEKLVAVSEGTFQLEPQGFLNMHDHSAVLVRWWAERQGRQSDGHEIGVFRLDDGKIAEAWFYNEPSDADAFSAVFAFS
jgi:ketosteroid isomerase-like protein